MTRKYLKFAALIVSVLAVAFWWRAGNSGETPAKDFAHETARTAPAQPKLDEAGAVATAAKPVEMATVKMWGKATSTEGQRLEPKTASTNPGSESRGRTAYFDASSVIALKDLQRGNASWAMARRRNN